MNRRQKIIVSVTGIFIVLLALVGITFAYFLTRIQGNNNPTSISVTTANLSLVYADDSSDLITSTEPIIPTFIDTKSFTVTNNGNATVTDYAVILEEYGVTYASDATLTNEDGSTTDVYAGQSTDLKYDDFKLTITCTSYENYGKTGEAVSGTCNGMDGVLPAKSDILLMNNIDAGITHVYELTLEYKETDENQSADMNKTITGKINIMDTKGTVDLTGEVAVTYDVGDYVQINSEEKMSPIYSDGTYKLMGVKPDNHNIKICDSENPTCTKENANSNSDLVILKGETASSSGNTITITDSSRTVNMNVTSSGVTVGTIEKYNPYASGTLAYKIYASATSGEEGKTVLVNSPSTPIGQNFTYEKQYEEYISYENYNGGLDLPDSDTYICYSGFSVDQNKGVFIMQGEKECSAAEIADGYILSLDAKTREDEPNKVYRPWVMADWDDNGVHWYGHAYVEYSIKEQVVNNTKELSKTTDNDGPTYYFRGGVEDNYVNFAQKCWRIVRIQGDGSIKLILEDNSQTCSTSMDRDSYFGPTTYPYSTVAMYDPSDSSWQCNEAYVSDFSQNNGIPTVLKTFQNNISNYLGSLKPETWCWGTDGVSVNSMECKDRTIDKFSDGTSMYVGTLTYSETQFAGSAGRGEGSGEMVANYYLLSDYMRNQNISMWTMTTEYFPVIDGCSGGGFSMASFINNGINYSYDWDGQVDKQHSVRPAVVLRDGITATGTGTITDPYKVG